jgi:AraC-like DNA-binding protein
MVRDSAFAKFRTLIWLITIMRYTYQRPHHSLTDYVRTALIIDHLSADENPDLPLVITGVPAVFFQFRAENNTDKDDILATLFGAPVPAEFELDRRYRYVVAYFFKPFAIACLFDLPGKILARGPVDLMQWSDSHSPRLRRQLQGCQTPAGQVEVLDQFLVRQLELNHRACEVIRIATDRMMLDSGAEMLSLLPHEVHVTQRTFQRMFKKYVGISASEYRRICQFQQSFQQVRSREFNRLSDVAIDNGFADQSHFVRSFREFAHTTPGKYLEDGLGKS